MSPKAKIKSEFAKFEAADQLASASLGIYGALKATESRLPRLVAALLPALEVAIGKWSETCEEEPDSEGTTT
jgi:hypothetical protein